MRLDRAGWGQWQPERAQSKAGRGYLAWEAARPLPLPATAAGLSGPPRSDVATVHAPLFLRLVLLCSFPLRQRVVSLGPLPP